MRTTLALRQSAEITEDIKLQSSQRFWYDGAYYWTEHYPEEAKRRLGTEAALRDLYLDYSLGDFDLRLGQQQVVWGETVGFFIADQVNAKDYREFILPDLSEINIPEPALDLEYTKDPWHVELLWIPYPRFNKNAPQGSEFAFFEAAYPPGTTVGAPVRPADSLNHSELGARLGYLWHQWDINAFYLYTWDKSPVYPHILRGETLAVEPEYKRLSIFGFTFSKEVSNIVWRGEAAFNKNAFFTTSNPQNEDGIKKSDFADYALGADFRTSDSTRMNLQLLQRIIFSPDSMYIGNPDQVRTYLTLFVSGQFFDDKFLPELFVAASPSSPDAMLRPKLAYKIKNNWLLAVGIDWFLGDSNRLFGQFESKSRVYGELSYQF